MESKVISVADFFGIKVAQDGTIDVSEVMLKMVEYWNETARKYVKEAISYGEDDEFSETNEPVRFRETEKELQKLKSVISFICTTALPDTLHRLNFVDIDDLFDQVDQEEE